jgi:hypothetical protein
MSKIEDSFDVILARLRDWLQGAEELKNLLNEYLSVKVETEERARKHNWDPERISWAQKEGPSGTYFLAEKQDLQDFKAAVQDLENHKGKMNLGEYFYWKFDSGAIGRKPSRKGR